MNHRLFGVIGHVDHGKTALVRALTGMETDRLAEEKRRGISIALGFAHLRVGDVSIDFVDMPGHERFVRTMVAGATGIDAVLLVVAANEGVKPQTIEHLDIAALLGICHAVIAISKVDLVDEADAQERAREVADLVADAGLKAHTPVLTSATTGAVLEALTAQLADTPVAARRDDGFPYLPIDRAFSVPGHGTVVTGTLRRGRLTAADTVEAVPSGLKPRIRGLQVHGEPASEALPGQRVAVNLRGVEPGQTARGTVLARPGLLPASDWLTVELRSVVGAAPLPSGAALRLLQGTEDTRVRLRLLDRDVLEPGGTAFAQLRCETQAHVPARERFILRTESPAHTVAGGRILIPGAARERRHGARLLERLAVVSRLEGAELVADAVARSGGRGAPVDQLAMLSGSAPERVRAWLPGLPVVILGDLIVGQAALDTLVGRLPAYIEKNSPADGAGLSVEQIARDNPALSAPVIAEAAAQALAAGQLRQVGSRFHRVRPSQDQERAREEEALTTRIAATYQTAGLAPPEIAQVSKDPRAQRLANRLVREGVLVRATDRVQKRELLFHRDAVGEARRALTLALADGAGMRVAEIGTLLGISRKYSVPLLEYLDSIQVTRRTGDCRVLGSAQATC